MQGSKVIMNCKVFIVGINIYVLSALEIDVKMAEGGLIINETILEISMIIILSYGKFPVA
jgi:hypothetical protein